jgi:uncharacterized low-complexity protein
MGSACPAETFRLASAAGSTIGSGGGAHHAESLTEQPTECRAAVLLAQPAARERIGEAGCAAVRWQAPGRVWGADGDCGCPPSWLETAVMVKPTGPTYCLQVFPSGAGSRSGQVVREAGPVAEPELSFAGLLRQLRAEVKLTPGGAGRGRGPEQPFYQ